MKKRQHWQSCAIAYAMLASFVLVLSSAAPAQQILKLGGTGSALGSMKKIGEAFHELHPDIEVKILPSLGSSGGLKAVTAGAIDVALSSRPLKDGERTAGLSDFEYARTPFVFVTRDPVGIAGVTAQSVTDMFSGAISTWPNGQRIRPIIRPAEETDTRIAKAVSATMSRVLDSLLQVPGMVIALTDQDCLEHIGSVSGTLAFTSLAQVLTWQRQFVVLTFNGVIPSVTNISNGTYPFYRSYYLVRNSGGNRIAAMFAEFVRSAEGRKLLEESGNQPIGSGLAEN